MKKRIAALMASTVMMVSLSGCDLLNKALNTAQNIQGATISALTAIQWPIVLAAKSLDMVGTIAFTCPTVTPTTAGAASYTFDFGTGCTPSPVVISAGRVSGSATVAVSGNTLTVSFVNFSYADTALSGSVTVTSSGSAGSRTLVVNGSLTATYKGTAYPVTLSNVSVTVTGTGSSITIAATGTATVTSGDITFSLAANNLQISQSSFSGAATLSATGGLAASVDLQFQSSGGSVNVAGKLGAISFSFGYNI